MEWRALELVQVHVHEKVGGEAEKGLVYIPVNTMALVAPPAVLRALYAFQEDVRVNNPRVSAAKHDQRLSDLLREIRHDVHPKSPDDGGIVFHLMDAPPSRAY